MENSTYPKVDLLLERARALEGKTLAELNVKGLEGEPGKPNKGAFGTFIERFFFNINPPNTPCVPDVPECKVEIKTSPLIRSANGKEIKVYQRLKLGKINYPDLVNEEPVFEKSCLVRKNANLLLIFYWWVEGQKPWDARVAQVELVSMKEIDYHQLRRDWESIKARASQDPNSLKESQTSYLVASTSGAGKKIATKDRPKERSFSLRQGYVNTLYEKFRLRRVNKIPEALVSLDWLRGGEIVPAMEQKFAQYIGMDQHQIFRHTATKPTAAKQLVDVLSKAMLGLKGRQESEELLKADILLRSMRLEEDGRPQEHVSFKNFDFTQLVQEEWEESEFRNTLYSKIFFVLYRKTKQGLVFEGTRIWSMPEETIESNCRDVWERTRSALLAPGKLALPKVSEDAVAHVRPKASTGADKAEDALGRKFVKSCFWLRNTYIQEQLKLGPAK